MLCSLVRKAFNAIGNISFCRQHFRVMIVESLSGKVLVDILKFTKEYLSEKGHFHMMIVENHPNTAVTLKGEREYIPENGYFCAIYAEKFSKGVEIKKGKK